jgi:hypothetical protein
MDLYTEWNTYCMRQEGDELTKNAKIQSITILDEILRKIFSKDNPALVLQFNQASTKIPQDLLGVYTYLTVKEYFPQANLDVIVRDIARVMMFSLQTPRYTTFDTWYHSFMQKIETLDLLYGQITWEQVYLEMVLWALQLMGGKYILLRHQIKMNLPSATKEILKEPKETLDKVMEMISKWETPMLICQTTKEMKGQTYEDKQVTLNIMCKMLGLPLQNIQGADNTCPYCESPHHTREQCMERQSDEDLKDNAKLFIPSLKKIHKTQEEILQQGMQKGLKPHQETLMKSILYTLKGMKIGGNTIKELMDTEEYHQGESNECNENAYLQHKGRPTRLESTQDQEYDEEDDPYCQDLEESTYDSDQECQEHDDRYGNQDIPQEDEDDHGYQDHDDRQGSDKDDRQDDQSDQQESETYNDAYQQESDQEEGETYDQDDPSDDQHSPMKVANKYTSWLAMESVEDHEGRQSPQGY